MYVYQHIGIIISFDPRYEKHFSFLHKPPSPPRYPCCSQAGRPALLTVYGL